MRRNNYWIIAVCLIIGASVLSGFFIGAKGEQPVQNTLMSLEWQNNTYSYSNTSMTDLNGYYEMRVAEGIVNISTGSLQVNGNRTITVFNSTGFFNVSEPPSIFWKNITLNPFPEDTAVIEGHVYKNGTNEPLQAKISIIFSGDYFWGTNSTNTNIGGYYKINLPASDAVVSVFANGYYPDVINVTVSENQSIIIDFYLDKMPPLNSIVKGYVNNSFNNNPVNNASIIIAGINNTYLNFTTTNSSGYYEFNIPEGNFTLQISAENYFGNFTFFSINENETKWVNISLTPYPPDTAWVDGYVKDSGGNPIQNANVTVYGNLKINMFMIGTFTRNATTNATGYYNVSVPAVEKVELPFPNVIINISEISYVYASANGYFDNSTYDGIIEPGDVLTMNVTLDPMPPENCIVKGYVYMALPPPVNTPPTLSNPLPSNGSIDVPLKPDVSIHVEDPDGDLMDITINVTNADGGWREVVFHGGNGTYGISSLKEYIATYGKTYYWKVSVYDGTHYTNATFHFTTILPSILYVGGGGAGNYTSIQDAINDALDGMTIKVYPGIYDGPIVINKEIKLIGDSSIDAHGGYGIKIEANNTLVENFTVFNASNAIYAYNSSFTLHNITIRNCTVYDASDGIKFEHVKESVINESHVYNCTSNGIYLKYSNSNSIIASKIDNITGGLNENSIRIEYSNENRIENNRIFMKDTFRGIYLFHSDGNIVRNNKVSGEGNNGYGIDIWDDSDNNQILNNSVYTGSTGIVLGYADDNKIRGNIVDVPGDGIQLQAGECHNNLFEKNEIKSNNKGINLKKHPAYKPNEGNKFYNNTISAKDGIYLTACRNGTFVNNSIEATNYAIYIENSTNNSFINNTVGVTKFSFTYKGDIWIKNASMPAMPPSHWHSIGKFLEIENMSNAWLNLTIYYEDSDVSGLFEDTLKIWKWNGSWQEDGWNGSRFLDTAKNIVGVNITSFSIFAPLAMSPNHLPYAINPSPSNGSVDVPRNATLSVVVYDEDGDVMNVSFYNASNDALIGYVDNVLSGSEASIVWQDLAEGRTYYWYVIVNDSYGENKSEVWHFTTIVPKPSIVYVDDDYNNATPGWQYDHFNNIPDAINGVAENGIVYVYEGIYEGSVIIDKQISLISLGNPKNTIIKASGQNAVTIDEPCLLDGFTIRDAYSNSDNVRGIWIRANGCIIRNVTITNITAEQSSGTIYAYGIMINYASNAMLENVTIYDINNNDWIAYGVCLYESENNSLRNITIFNITSVSFAYGIYYSGGGNSEILYANISMINGSGKYSIYLKNSYNISLEHAKISTKANGYGINVDNADNIVIEKCDVSDEFYGIILDKCEHSMVRNNTIYDNRYGVTLWRDCHNITIENNTIFNSTSYGIYFYNSENTFNEIKENHVYDGAGYGIYFAASARNNTILSNHIFNNSDDGIIIYSSNNNISSNYIYNNGRDGIRICEHTSNNTILGNEIYENGERGIFLLGAKNNIVINNTCHNNKWGIVLQNNADNNTVTHNTNYENLYYGIIIQDSADNKIISNILHDNSLTGITILHSHRNNISSNKIFNNSDEGIHIHNSTNNTVYKNSIKNNTVGIKIEYSENNIIISSIIYSNEKGIVIKESNQNLVKYSKIFNNTIWGIQLEKAENNTILLNEIYNHTAEWNSAGIVAFSSSNYNNISSNIVYSNGIDNIEIWNNSFYNEIWSNIVYNAEYGILLSRNANNNSIARNTIYNNKYGIGLGHSNATWGGSADYNILRNNSIYENQYGLIIVSSIKNVIEENNICENNLAGFEMINASLNEVRNNDINNNSYGIHLIYENETHGLCYGTWRFNFETNSMDEPLTDFRWDQISSTERYLVPGNGARFNITAGINWEDIDYYYATSAVYSEEKINGSIGNNSIPNGTILLCLTAEGNYLKMRIDSYGWNLYFTYKFLFPFNVSSGQNNFSDNFIVSNDYGVHLADSSNNLIYNNYFNNTINAYDEGYNIWNISKTAGLNIVGGAWLGGNYWHDYAGNDTDGDGLGDTMLPYNAVGNILHGGDMHPLLMPENRPPVALDDYASVDEDSENNQIDVLSNDYDIDGDTLSIISVSSPSHGTAYHDGSFIYYTPAENYYGTDIFTYTITDGIATATATVYITVNNINDAPVALDDYASVDEDSNVIINVLSNDYDIDGSINESSIEITENPVHGNVSVNSNGTITYTPYSNYFGNDFFKYKVKDNEGAWSNFAQVNITINPVNDIPTVKNPHPANGSVDVALNAMLAVDVNDVDGDMLTVTFYDASDDKTIGTIEDVSSGTTASIIWPNLEYSTQYSWYVKISDGIATKTSQIWSFTTMSIPQYTLAVTVNPPDGGTVNPSGGTYNAGEVVTITAIANEGYEFSHWSGDASGTETSIEITMDSNKNIVANFQSVQINNLPEIKIIEPSNNSTVANIIKIRGKAWDIDGNESIVRVEVKIDDGEWRNAEGTTSWNYSWNTKTVENGLHRIYARAYDGEDYSNTVFINLNVANILNHPPSIEITQPLNGSEVKGNIVIKGKAWDIDGNESIVRVEVKIDDGEWINATGKINWAYTLDTTKLNDGKHTIRARSFDGISYSKIAVIEINVQNEEKKETPWVIVAGIIVLVAVIGLAIWFIRKK